jgi:hypothetical protein
VLRILVNFDEITLQEDRNQARRLPPVGRPIPPLRPPLGQIDRIKSGFRFPVVQQRKVQCRPVPPRPPGMPSGRGRVARRG